jgi:oligopeptidase A
VLDALFEVTRHLFGVSVQAADGQTPVWHPDVLFFQVQDAAGQPLASFYLDPYSRPETKRGGAWMDAVLPRKRRADGMIINPAAYMVCNQSRPEGADRPALMTHSEVTTLFHEFGHALQHLLTTVELSAASGIHNVEWDAVELASQFMENWCYHAPVLRRMSRHFETGDTLPDTLIARIIDARTFRAGSATLRQLFFGAVDMELHARYTEDDPRTPNAIKDALAPAYSVMPVLPEDRFLCGFAHIFAGGYAAGYYSYKWAEVLSADAFAAFEEAGLDNPDALEAVGRRFRGTILAQGGARHPMDIFRDFRGRAPAPDALLRQLKLLA